MPPNRRQTRFWDSCRSDEKFVFEKMGGGSGANAAMEVSLPTQRPGRCILCVVRYITLLVLKSRSMNCELNCEVCCMLFILYLLILFYGATLSVCLSEQRERLPSPGWSNSVNCSENSDFSQLLFNKRICVCVCIYKFVYKRRLLGASPPNPHRGSAPGPHCVPQTL